jgi:phage terminase small subunit
MPGRGLGRPTKPIALHLLEGTGRKHRLKKREGELLLPSGPIGPPPSYIKGEALAEWKRLTSNKDYAPVLNAAFRCVFIDYCELHARMVENIKTRGKSGITGEERRTLNSLRVQLGLTPASQSNVKMPKKEEPKDKWKSFEQVDAG